jgi:hypothetical protein
VLDEEKNRIGPHGHNLESRPRYQTGPVLDWWAVADSNSGRLITSQLVIGVTNVLRHPPPGDVFNGKLASRARGNRRYSEATAWH